MKIKSFIKIYCFLFSILYLRPLFGADDFESRNTISYEFKLPNSIRLDCEQSLRLSGKELAFKQTFTELSFSFEVINDLRILIPIRYSIYDDKVKNRYSVGATYKIGKKPIKLKFKSRFQSIHEKKKDPKNLYRNKVYAHYKISKKLEPFFSYEIFNPINLDNNSLSEYRITFGTVFDLPRQKSLKLYFQFKAEDLNKKNPEETNIFALAISLN